METLEAIGLITTAVASIVTAIAILLGGFYAVLKLQVFRDLKPHLTITQRVSHRHIGTKYVHVAVTASLNNSSKVAIEIHRSFSRLQAISQTNWQIQISINCTTMLFLMTMMMSVFGGPLLKRSSILGTKVN